MPKKQDDLQKHTLNLRQGDFDKMGEMFPSIGPSVAVRKLISTFVDKNYTVNGPTTAVETSNL